MNKMYIVRSDLGKIYKMVQGAHALAAYSLEHQVEFKNWNNEYLIFLDIKDNNELLTSICKLKELNQTFSVFYEPDIDSLTAIACYADEDIFKYFKVAK